MKNILKLVVLCHIFIFIGCNLDLEPESVVSVDSFWKTEDDARAASYGLYARLRTQSENLYQWGAGRSEEMTSGIQSASGREYLFENRLSPTHAGPDWLRLYTIINDANSIIKYVPNIPFTNVDERNEILAQAYAMRAYIYFILVRTWGGVPIVKDPMEEFNPSSTDSYKERSTSEEVFSLIKEDLEESLALFGDNNAFPSGRCYWSKPAVNALKGDVYLWTAKLEGGGQNDLEAALLALLDAQKSDVALQSSFNNVFREAQKGNKEIFFAIKYDRVEAGNNYAQNMYIRNEDIPADAESAGKKLIGVGGGQNRWAPSEALRSEFVNDDTRKNVTFAELWVTRNGTRQLFASVALKYKCGVSGGKRYFSDDMIIYRYADVLLMIAEAKNALRQNPENEINEVRKRAYGSKFDKYRFASGTQEENDRQILRERKLELALEGKRWWDLIRFGKVFELVPAMAGKTEGHLLFPISQETLSVNNKLEQNEAYKDK